MDLSKYLPEKCNWKTFGVPLPAEVDDELRRIRAEHQFQVRAWARDLILSHLPELREELKGKQA